MIWVAIENADTHKVSEFEQTTKEHVPYIMDDFGVDTSNPTRFRLRDVEGGRHIIYDGVTYKGGSGYNLLVASKYVEV